MRPDLRCAEFLLKVVAGTPPEATYALHERIPGRFVRSNCGPGCVCMSAVSLRNWNSGATRSGGGLSERGVPRLRKRPGMP